MRARLAQTFLRGFTLIEMIIVIVVLGAIFAVGGLVLGRAFESYSLTATTTDVDWQGRVALERMVRELREIRTATATDLDMASNTQIRFVDSTGRRVCLYRDGATSRLMRSTPADFVAACNTANPQPLADYVANGGLNFFYYRNDGNDAATPAEVYYVSVTLNVVQGQISETYRASITPRSF